MVSGLSALGFAPNAPATGRPVCKRVTPRPSNGTLHPLCFQHTCLPSFPSCLNRNSSIPFPFMLLQATPSPTGGYTPLPFFIGGASPSPLSRNHSDTGDSTQSRIRVFIPHVPRACPERSQGVTSLPAVAGVTAPLWFMLESAGDAAVPIRVRGEYNSEP
jgi:hypothetical protein